MIISSTIFYNDTPDLLKECLCRLRDNGHFVLAIDGAYQEFMEAGKNPIPYSTDGCLDVAYKYADKVIESPAAGWVDEVEKRNQAFINTPDGCYVFTIDTDEMVRPWNCDKLILTADAYRIMLNQKTPRGTVNQSALVRIFKKYPDLAYKYQHCRVYRLNQHDGEDLSTGLVTRSSSAMNRRYSVAVDDHGAQLAFDHVPDRRPAERVAVKKIYYHNMREKRYPY